jgi:hypothetical protein
MIFLIPAIGIVFLFIGILIFAFLFINNSSGRFSSVYDNFLRDEMLFNPFYFHGGSAKSPRTSQSEWEKEGQMERENYYFKERIHKEIEKKKQIDSTALAYSVTMGFSLLLYIIGGVIVLWYFRETWQLLNWQKILFMIFYSLGFVFFIIAVVNGSNAYRLGEFPSLHLISRNFPHWQNLSMEKNLDALSEEYRIIASTNMAKERYLQTAKFLFIFSYCNIFILALILLIHYYN